MDTGNCYRLNGCTGEQVRCDSRGVDINPFDPKITGRYNYDDRLKVVEKTHTLTGPVNLPTQLKPNQKRNYVPQHQRLDGYAQMPRMVAPPYANTQLQTHIDGVRRRRAMRANASIMREKGKNLPPLSSLTATGASIATTPKKQMPGKSGFQSYTPVQKRSNSDMGNYLDQDKVLSRVSFEDPKNSYTDEQQTPGGYSNL